MTAVGLFGPEVVLNGKILTPLAMAATSITVKNTDGTAATLYTDATGATSTGTNVATTDSRGQLSFYAVPGYYDLAFTDSVGSQTLRVSVPEPYLLFANVKQFGAKGDGATVDTAAVAAAVAAVASGGTVFFPAGTYIVGGILLTNPNVRIAGAGNGSTLFLNTATNLPVIKITSAATGCTVENITINGNGANNATNGSDPNAGVVSYANDTTVQNCSITNCYAAGVFISQCIRARVSGNRVTGGSAPTGQAIWFTYNVTDSVISNNIIDGCVYGIWLYDNGTSHPCQRVLVSGNEIANLTGTSTTASQGAAISLAACYAVTVVGNNCFTSTTRGIYAIGGGQHVISSNIAQQCGNGTGLSGIDVDDSPYCVISSNRCLLNGGYGIWMGGSSYATVTGNHLFNNCQTASARVAGGGAGANLVMNYDGTLDTLNNTITGNVLVDDQGVKTCSYGILQWTGAAAHYQNNVVAGNTLLGHATAQILMLSTSDRVYGNAGYNPRGHAVTQPAVPASTVAATNTTNVDCTVHVAGGTVSAIAVGGSATGLTSGSFRVPAGQTITLTYTVAPTWQWFGD